MPNWNPRANEIFLDALSIDSSARRKDFIEGTCGADAELRGQVFSLLDASERAGDFLESPLCGPDVTYGMSVGDLQTGDTIGPYKLREQIGEGGMGVVYVAEQSAPVRRKVALKVIKPGMDSKEVIARFDAEKQALALMDHPHVARVIDAGTTEEGRPYFVMELVRGCPLTEYCDEAKLDTRARLKLFLKVCQGVQHAHLKGIIHRDLKPGNVLVTLHDGVPVPKVIDFGVAKALNQKLTEHSIYTQFRQMIGTPAYMSPEQAELSALDVDTRSDVYSLGVLLYELLTGTTPFDKETLKSKNFDEMRRMIREQEPPRPSERISTLDAASHSTLQQQRGLAPHQYRQFLHRELDWIVMKALEKDRSRRYETASSLAQDVQRYLNDEPVEACPPSTLYRLQKYARRHKALLTTTILVAFTAIIGTAVSLRYARRSSSLAERAQTAQSVAEQHALEAKRLTQWSRTLLYASDMKLASDAIANEDVPRAAELLKRHVPRPGQADLRGFEWRHFSKRVAPPRRLEIPQGGWIDDVELSPDGRWLATTAPEGVVLVYATSSWRQQRSFLTGAESVEAVAWSPDSQRLSAACADGTLRIWDLATGQLQLTLQAHADYTPDVAFSPDGEAIYSCGNDQTARKWDARSGKALLEFVGHQREVTQLAVSPQGKLLGTASSDGTFAIWRADTGEGLQSYSIGDAPDTVTCVSFSPDGQFVAAGNVYGEVHVAESRTGKRLLLTKLVDGVEALKFISHSETLLAAADRGGVIQLLPVPRKLEHATGPSSAAILRWKAHDGRALSLTASSDGTCLISGGRDGTVRIWTPELQSARWILQSTRWPHGDIESHSGRRLFVAGEQLSAWDLGERQQIHHFLNRGKLASPWRRIASSENGRFLAAVRQGLLVLVELATKRIVQDWTLDAQTDPSRELAISPDGEAIAFVDSEQQDTVSVYRSGGPPQPELLPARQCSALAYSPDGRWIAVGVGDVNEVQLRNIETGGEVILKGHSNSVSGLAFAPDGDLLASVSHDRLLKVWRLPAGELLFSIVAHRGPIETVCFSPDGRTIATAGHDRQVTLWHTATGQPLGALRREDRPFKKLTFSDDGRALVGLMGDSSVVVYDAASTSATTARQRPIEITSE